LGDKENRTKGDTGNGRGKEEEAEGTRERLELKRPA
jgi:hypothetical protein